MSRSAPRNLTEELDMPERQAKILYIYNTCPTLQCISRPEKAQRAQRKGTAKPDYSKQRAPMKQMYPSQPYGVL